MPTIDDLKQTLSGEEILFLLNNDSSVKPVFSDGSTAIPTVPQVPSQNSGGINGVLSGASKQANSDVQTALQATNDYIRRLSLGDLSQGTFDIFRGVGDTLSNAGQSVTDKFNAGVSSVKDAAQTVADLPGKTLADAKASYLGIGDSITNAFNKAIAYVKDNVVLGVLFLAAFAFIIFSIWSLVSKSETVKMVAGAAIKGAI